MDVITHVLGTGLLLVWLAGVSFLVVRGRATELALVAISTGVLQWPLMAVFSSLRLEYLTDISVWGVLLLAAKAGIPMLRRRALATAFALAALFALAMVGRGLFVDVQPALQASRQFLVPPALTVAGILLKDRIDWRRVMQVTAVWGLVVSVYMIVEKVTGRPPINPVNIMVSAAGGDRGILRAGLPSAYWADGIGRSPWFRPGGLFFNPPIAGIFLGTATYAALRILVGWRRWLVAVASALAATLAVARAGMVMIALVIVVPPAVSVVRRWPRAAQIGTLAVGGFLAITIGLTVSSEGNTGAHASGLVEGLKVALRHPFGTGFGTQGYFAASAGLKGVGSGESWLGVFIASTGLIGLLLVAIGVVGAMWIAWQAPHALLRPAALPVTAVAVAAVTESAGALRGTSAMWLLLGDALALTVPPLIARRSVSVSGLERG